MEIHRNTSSHHHHLFHCCCRLHNRRGRENPHTPHTHTHSTDTFHTDTPSNRNSLTEGGRHSETICMKHLLRYSRTKTNSLQQRVSQSANSQPERWTSHEPQHSASSDASCQNMLDHQHTHTHTVNMDVHVSILQSHSYTTTTTTTASAPPSRRLL